MENKPQDYHKTEKINLRATHQEKTLFEEIGREFGTKPTPTLNRLMQEHQEHKKLQGSQALGQTQAIMPQEIQEICERCKKKGCPAYPYFDAEAQKVLCVFPYEGKEPKIVRRSTPELKACSDAPILISMTRKRALEEDFQCRTEALTAQIDRAEEDHVDDKALVERLIGRENESVTERVKNVGEIRRLAGLLKDRDTVNQQLTRKLQPMQTYITENKKLSSWRSHTANYLLRVLDEMKIVETDRNFLKQQVEEFSHDPLVEKNASLMVEVGKRDMIITNKDEQIQGLKDEIQNQADVITARKQEILGIVSATQKMLREFKEFLPSNLMRCQQCVDGFAVKEYLRNTRKQIVDFEGYLETMMPTPKDNVLRGS
jgi:hypothetical protein